MGSRSKKILMMLHKDENSGQPPTEDYPEKSSFEKNEFHEATMHSNNNSFMDSSSKAMVETWLNNDERENQSPRSESSILNELNTHAPTLSQDPKLVELVEGNLPEAIDIIPTMNTSSDFENLNPKLVESNISGLDPTLVESNISGSSKNNEDFSPSEGSEYKPPRRAKKPLYKTKPSIRSSSTSSSDSSSSSSSSTSSSDSSNSCSSKSVNNVPILGVNADSDNINMEPGQTLSINEHHVEPESIKRKSRKRQKNIHQWKQNISKRLKNSGQEYVTKRGKTVQAKLIGPPCKDTCRLSCSNKISFEMRNTIFKNYWELGTHQRQRDFLASCVKKIQPATRRIKVTVNSTCDKPPRKPNSSYYFMINGHEVRVCKIFLQNTLSIGEKTLRNVADKISDNPLYIMTPVDNRGKHGKQCKLSDELIQSVRDHINSIPRVESHYLRSTTSREFIDGSLTVAELHRSYKNLRQAAAKEALNYDAYHRVFSTDFNIGLFVPRKDQCDECEAYKNAVDKEPLLAKHELHLEEKNLSRLELQKDIEKCKTIDNHSIIAIFDLQAVLPCPVGQSSAFFYKSKINCYNFTVSNVNDDKTFCFFWHEGLGKRGANEIGTCLYKFLEELSNQQPDMDLILYSDNCCGQQKNKFVFGMYYYVVNTLPIKSITHKFLIRGHTQNKADAVHSVIEKSIKRAKKAGPIYSPSEYISLIRNAKKSGNKFIVKEMNFDSFFDLKLLSEETYLNLNKDVDGNIIKLTAMKAIKFTKGSETYQHKTSYKSDTWIEANIKTSRMGNRKKINDIVLKVLYTEKLPIPNRKKEDIRQLIASNIVPKFYEPFYNAFF